MADKSIIVAISPHAAYNTAVMDWGWQCDQRNIPEFQTPEGEVVDYLPEGRVKRLKGEINIYLGRRWQERWDYEDIRNAIEGDRFKVMKEIKNG